MSDPLITFGKFVRNLLVINENTIKIGRSNFERADFNTAYIAIDTLARFDRVSRLETYDSSQEVLSLGAVWSGIVTVDFFGNDAYNRAIAFELLSTSQAAYDLKRTLGITIMQSSGPTDVRQLTGQQYGEQIQLEMRIYISEDTQISTKRIDTPQTSIIWSE